MRASLHRPVATLCLCLILGQSFASTLAWAEPWSKDNPFSRVPAGPIVPRPRPLPKPELPEVEVGGMSHRPQRIDDKPVFQLFPPTDPGLPRCEMPGAAASPRLRAFARLLDQYIDAYQTQPAEQIMLLSQLSSEVFDAVTPGSDEYIERLKYIDSQADRAPDPINDLARALQHRWEAAYGMQLAEKIQAGIWDDNAEPTLAERRHANNSNGSKIGVLIAWTALALVRRNPKVAAAEFSAFRMVATRTLVLTGGILAGGKLGDAYSGMWERNLPLAPAHVMRLGVERDNIGSDERSFSEEFIPMLISAGAGEAVYFAAEGKTVWNAARATIKAVRTADKAATPGKINPLVLAASVVVSIVVDRILGAIVDRLEYRGYRKDVTHARERLDSALAAQDIVRVYRTADELALQALAFSQYVKRPLLAPDAKFIHGMIELTKKYGEEDSPELQNGLAALAAERSGAVLRAMSEMDQIADADYQAYLALDALETQDPGAISLLPEVARERLRGYMDVFVAYTKGAPAGDPTTQQANFQRYVHGIRAAKDRELARELRAENYVKHPGHVLLQTSALLRTTNLPYLRLQADELMAQVFRYEGILRMATGQKPTVANTQM